MRWLAPILFAPIVIAQTSSRFESATIRPSQEPEGRASYFTTATKITLRNQTLKDCVRLAYDVKIAQVSGGARWVETQRFDIEATTARQVSDREEMAMLRALLLDRFKLALHRDSKMFSGYALLLAKGGLKIREVEPGPGRIGTRRGSLSGEAASMTKLAQGLSEVLNSPVIDMTETPGVFTFALTWNPDLVRPGSLTGADDPDTPPTVLPDNSPGPSLFAAIEEQLGLRLDRRKVPLEVLVIDRAERPR